jgi:hypothetical protein
MFALAEKSARDSVLLQGITRSGSALLPVLSNRCLSLDRGKTSWLIELHFPSQW